MSIGARRVLSEVLCVGLLGACSGCRRDEGSEQNDASAEPASLERAGVVVFPDELQVEDASVNEFLQQAMTVCTTGDYEAFRLLWSARQEPLARDEFEKGWQAVLEIRIRALEKVVLAPQPGSGLNEGQVVYAAYAEVQLDPDRLARQGESERQVVLMLVREHEAWRLAPAPKSVRTWLKEKVRAASAAEAATPERERGEGENEG